MAGFTILQVARIGYEVVIHVMPDIIYGTDTGSMESVDKILGLCGPPAAVPVRRVAEFAELSIVPGPAVEIGLSAELLMAGVALSIIDDGTSGSVAGRGFDSSQGNIIIGIQLIAVSIDILVQRSFRDSGLTERSDHRAGNHLCIGLDAHGGDRYERGVRAAHRTGKDAV